MNFVTFHGMGFNFDEKDTFGPNLTNKLQQFGEVYNCHFDLNNLEYTNWEETAKNLIKDNLITPNTIIFAHSLGTLFAIKFLAKFNLTPKALISIAGGYHPQMSLHPLLKTFTPTIIDFDFIKHNVKNKVFIYSNNDRFFDELMQQNYIKAGDFKPVFVPNKGHFGRTEKVLDLDEAILEVKNILEL